MVNSTQFLNPGRVVQTLHAYQVVLGELEDGDDHDNNGALADMM